jgi:prevent-host-death family protein
MTLHSLKDLRASLGSVVREAMANPDEEHVITDNGTPVAAIVPLGELRRLRAQARSAELRRRSAEPLDEAVTHEEAMRIVNERIGRSAA